jgi:hypothetical protein
MNVGHYIGKTESGLKCEYWLQRSKNDKYGFILVVYGKSHARFNLSNEGIIEKTAMTLGLLNEIKIRDENFDHRVLIETETPGVTSDILKNDEIRAGILSVFDKGIKYIQSYGDRIEIKSGLNFPIETLKDAQFLVMSCALIEAIITNKTISKTNSSINWRGGFSMEFGANSVVTIALPVLALMLMGMVLIFLIRDVWNPDHLLNLTLYFLPISLICVSLISKKLGIRTTRGQHIRALPIYLVYASLLGSLSALALDYLLPKEHFVYQSVVIRKDYEQRKNGSYWLWLSPVDDPADTWEKGVSESDFLRAVPYKSKIVSKMVRGGLGLERITESALID